MKLKSRLNFALILVLALPICTILVSIMLVTISWLAQIESSDDITAPRFIRPVLKEILEEEMIEDSAPRGVILVLDHRGEMTYMNPEIKVFVEEISNSDPVVFYQNLMERMPETPFNLSVYRYKGNAGIVMYVQDAMAIVKMTQIGWFVLFILYLAFIVFPALGLNFMVRPMMKSLLTLEKAIREIGKGNLDEPISVGKRSQRGLYHLEKAMEEMRLELKENRDRSSRAIMSISHDLKTPLTSIKGYLEAISDGIADNPEEQEKYLAIIREKTDQLEERIMELIHFSRIRTAEWQSFFVPIAIGDFLLESSGVLSNDLALNRRRFESDIKLPPGIQIMGDRNMLFRVLENLTDNASRYTVEDDLIRFSARQELNYIRICVEDSGPGISEKHKAHIFENFYRADPGRNSRGLGIGLASAANIVRSHGGEITYYDSDLGGAGFRILLPLG